MKKFCLLIGVVFAMVSLASCGEDTTISGISPYSCEYECTNNYVVLTSDTLTEKLRNAVLNDIKNLKKKHDHSWEYKFEGSDVDNALKEQDKLAMSYYDDAVQDLNTLKAQFDALLEKNADWGKGVFTYKYKYTIKRLDKTLAESDEVTFSYRKKN